MRKMHARKTLFLVFLSVLFLASPLPIRANTEDRGTFFESRIRPLLIQRCGSCHGKLSQKNGLRLDSYDTMLKGGKRGPVIVPGNAENSLLISAIRQTHDTLKMPPEKPLSDQVVNDFVTWINDGAEWPESKTDTTTRNDNPTSPYSTLSSGSLHWALQPISHPDPPEVSNGNGMHAIDRFVSAQRKQHLLRPVTMARPRTLIRRLYFDLHGLPPSPQEIKNAAKNLTPWNDDAWRSLIDRLLASPRYGERWARHWLDVARYADTAGDGADYPVREAVKYRNWVIDALNADLPYDEFVREQIAGDIIAREGPKELYASRVTATGFLAIGKRYGYKPSPDYQHLDFADVIDSLGRSLLGLSIGCARCHDHKYDPVSAADYYALYGIMQSTTWAFPGGEEQKHPSHFPALVPPEEAERREKVKAAQLSSIDHQLSALRSEKNQKDIKWHAGAIDLGMEAQRLGKPLVAPWVCAGPIEVKTESQSPYAHVHPPGTRGVHIGSGLNTDGIRYVFEDTLKVTDRNKMYFTLDFRTQKGADQKGAYRFYLGQGVVQSLAVEFSILPDEFVIRNGSQWQVLRTLETGKWYTLQIAIDPEKKTYSGVVGTPDNPTRFTDKRTDPNWNGIVDCFICDATGHVPGPASARDIDNVGLQDIPFPSPGSKAVPAQTQTNEDKARLTEIQSELTQLSKQRKVVNARTPYEVAYGVSEGTPVNARIQLRGEPDELANEVPRRFLEVLGGYPVANHTKRSGRLDLANWLTQKSNPLTARVFVNRVWQWHFGRGIVATPSDFGSRGAMPTHPELLDWLASEFIQSGWSLKQLQRLILKSRTYRLASTDSTENLAADPENRFHWKYSRRPLDAESIRDAMLLISGNMDPTQPGPHPFPDVNSWGFTIHHPFHEVYDSNHRSVYLMVQRNRRHPYLVLFDSADPNLSIGLRQPTITPTQTLYLMNSKFVHEQADGFSKRIIQSADTIEQRVYLAFEYGHGKQPPESEFQAAVKFISTYSEKLTTQQHPSADPEAWSALARVILTSNGFLFVD